MRFTPLQRVMLQQRSIFDLSFQWYAFKLLIKKLIVQTNGWFEDTYFKTNRISKFILEVSLATWYKWGTYLSFQFWDDLATRNFYVQETLYSTMCITLCYNAIFQRKKKIVYLVTLIFLMVASLLLPYFASFHRLAACAKN